MSPSTRADATRARILDAAWGLIAERGNEEVAMADIAAAAGVSRQLVYIHFESRAQLLAAMTHRFDETSGFHERIRAACAAPPGEALERVLRTWFDYLPAIDPVARALEAASLTGDAGAAAWNERLHDLLVLLRRVVGGLVADDRLADGWTPETATDWIWAQAHPSAWRHLVIDRGWPHDRFVEDTIERVAKTVTIPPARRNGRSRSAPRTASAR